MPLYEYYCECKNEVELLLTFQGANKPQKCECGKTMQRKISVCSSVIRQTGNQMALDTLNSKRNGMPDRHWKPTAEKYAAMGLEKQPKKYY